MLGWHRAMLRRRDVLPRVRRSLTRESLVDSPKPEDLGSAGRPSSLDLAGNQTERGGDQDHEHERQRALAEADRR